jgi:hypothetical protein
MTSKALAGITFMALGSLALSAPIPSEEMDLIISSVDSKTCGNDYSHARALVRVDERPDGTTDVGFKVQNAAPLTLYTVWLKLDGLSPISGAGAVPAVASTDIRTVIVHADTPSAAPANAFYTDGDGNAAVTIRFDFHFSDDLYPFSKYDPAFADVPIGDTPFTLRVNSHCADGLQHGLVPGPHEPTFQISLP